MSTEHVEDLLSAYLDNALTQEEWYTVALHLQTCDACNTVLEDFRHFDELLSTQPRMIPGTTLRERVFAITDYLDFLDDSPEDYSLNNGPNTDALTSFDSKQGLVSSIDTERIRSVPSPAKKQRSTRSNQETKAFVQIPQRRDMRIQRSMYGIIAACLLLTLGIGSLIGWNTWQAHSNAANNPQGIVPPQSPQQGGPLPAGIRFVYLSNRTLWSSPQDTSTRPAQLTPSNVTVAPHWTVTPPSANHVGGNQIAYIDMQQGYVHIIRSDGQNDTRIQQRVLPTITVSAWNSPEGKAVLQNLSWSPDGGTLAFVAFSSTTGESSRLYLYSTVTNTLQAVASPTTSSAANIVWSPNGVRVAFTQTSKGVTSILDYDTLTKQTMVVTTISTTLDNVLSLDWSPVSSVPAITWSTGTPGHVDEVALRYVGTDTSDVQILTKGTFTQALYASTGNFGKGSWLLTNTNAENEDTLFSLTLLGTFSAIVNGNLLEDAGWTPDGQHITFLDMLPAHTGTFHSIDMANGVNTILARSVDSTPEPVLSSDGQNLLYSSVTHVTVTDAQNHTIHFKLPGMASTFLWSATSPHTAIVTLQDGTHGIYLVNTQANTAQLVSMQQAIGPLQWTQVS